MLRGARLRRPAWCLGDLRAILGHGEGCGLRLPQAEAFVHGSAASDSLWAGAPLRGSGPSCFGVGVGRWNTWLELQGTHTTAKNPSAVLGIQAYIAYVLTDLSTDT
jgi:hypothetical protein